MNTNTVLRFLSWALLTWLWIEGNCLFFNAIINAVNEQIRQQVVDDEGEGECEEE